MRQDSLRNLQIGLTEVSRLLLPFAILWLLGAIGLGWLVNSVLILLGIIIVTPIVAYFGFRWWLRRNLVQAACPVCSQEFASLNQTEFRCPNCGEPLRAEHGRFQRLTPPDTIEVSAIEVPGRAIED
jgi:predicted RNA-binding Zn-ribbon protein involved in translation (DUF1610 family)